MNTTIIAGLALLGVILVFYYVFYSTCARKRYNRKVICDLLMHSDMETVLKFAWQNGWYNPIVKKLLPPTIPQAFPVDLYTLGELYGHILSRNINFFLLKEEIRKTIIAQLLTWDEKAVTTFARGIDSIDRRAGEYLCINYEEEARKHHIGEFKFRLS